MENYKFDFKKTIESLILAQMKSQSDETSQMAADMVSVFLSYGIDITTAMAIIMEISKVVSKYTKGDEFDR